MVIEQHHTLSVDRHGQTLHAHDDTLRKSQGSRKASINADINEQEVFIIHEDGGIIEDPRMRKRFASALDRSQTGSALDGILITEASQKLLGKARGQQ